ncbi:MAG: hypothetical protein K0Q51_920 [Rickettsiaceae bacterium]|jgi:flagellar basal body rod protein FlgG|nr:hypothetical protein [Rickettsiaceae bacterium]
MNNKFSYDSENYELKALSGGYFRIQYSDKTIGYIKEANIQRGKDNKLTTSYGQLIVPEITIPGSISMETLDITEFGEVRGYDASEGRVAYLGSIIFYTDDLIG